MGTDAGTAAAAYETLKSTAPTGTSALAMTAIGEDTQTTLVVAQATGSWNHETGVITLTDQTMGTGTFTDSNGTNDLVNNGLIKDDDPTNGTLVLTQVSQTYDYVSYIAASDAPTTPVGQIGIATGATNVPTSGQANYTGDSFVAYNQGGGTSVILTGDSSANVDFGAGTVNATLSNFAVQGGGGAAIDTVTLTNMQINGTTFGGGTISTSLGGSGVDLTGANSRVDAKGNFYGYDATYHIPDEIGATALKQGDGGYLGAEFIAD